MTVLAGLVISGLVGGGLTAMIAIGLVMTYTTTGIFNIAQGSVAFLAAFAFLELHEAAGLPVVVSAVLTVLIIAPLFGLLLEKCVFRRLSTAPELARIVGTVGLALAIPAFVIVSLQLLGQVPGIDTNLISVSAANPIPLGPDPSRYWNIGLHIVISSDQVIILVFTAVTAIGYWYLLRHTRLGLEMRAVVDGHGLAAIRGVSHSRVSRLAWTLSFSSAALVGVCGSISIGLDPNSYLLLLFVAAAAAVLGGLRSIPLAFTAALLLGVLQNLVVVYLQKGPLTQVTGLGSAVPFIAMLVGLYIMSRRRGRVAGVVSSANDAPVELTRERRTSFQRIQTAFFVVLFAVLIMCVFGQYWDEFVAQGLCMSIIFLSYVVITGQAGIISLAQAGIVTCGGLLAGWLAGTYGLPLWAAALFAILAAVIAGLVVAIPAARLGGLQLALATLALAFIFDQLIFEVPALQGPSGTGWTIPRPSFAASNSRYSLLLLGVLVVFVLLVRNYQLSQLGRSTLAVRGSRAGAATTGISLVRPVLVAFGFSALIAGVGGFFLAQTLSQVSGQSNPPLNALLWVTIAITIGIRRPSGAIIAGMSAALLPQVLTYVTTSTEWPELFFGLGAVALAQYPGGTLDLQLSQLKWLRDRLLPEWFIERTRSFYTGKRSLPATGHGSTPANTPSERVLLSMTTPAPPVGRNSWTVDPGSVVGRPTYNGSGIEPVPPSRQCRKEAGDSSAGLVVRNLQAGYGELQVLHSIDIVARPGEITAVFGANGSGKSTLCSVLAGLVPASSGEIELGGESLMNVSGLGRLTRGLFVVTESRAIFPNLTVEENLRVALKAADRVDEALKQSVELQSRRHTRAGMLSGGEQQLLAMIPALVVRPRLLIADEPNLGLAPQARERVLGICEVLRDQGSTVLLIEERPGDVYEISDQIVFLSLGRVQWQCPRADVSADVLIDSYLAAQQGRGSN